MSDGADLNYKAIHERWILKRNRRQESPKYEDSWYAEQCGACRFFIALSGKLGLDYGACCNANSAFDGVVRFEHDGCSASAESKHKNE